MVAKSDPLTHLHRDETRTAYILQAVESAWEGVDRRKPTDAKEPPVAKDLNGVVVTVEPVSGQSSHLENLEEEEVCVWSSAFSLLQPLLSPSKVGATGSLFSFVSALGKGFLLEWADSTCWSVVCCLRES